MGKGRLEAFSDGVIAVIITIMVAGAEGPARRGPRRDPADGAGVPRLRAELRVHRHLLEQPPSPAAHRVSHRRPDHVGEPASAVLVVARAGGDRLARREPVRGGPDGGLWLPAVHVRLRVSVPDAARSSRITARTPSSGAPSAATSRASPRRSRTRPPSGSRSWPTGSRSASTSRSR